jgi:metal-dependent amidase/aminoacylase/carboxypeptidase family protein
VIEKMNGRAAHSGDASRKIWEFAELGYKENKSADLLKPGEPLDSAGLRPPKGRPGGRPQ